MKFYADISNDSKLHLLDRARFDSYLSNISHPDKKTRVSVEIKKIEGTRSVNANDYYWFGISLIVDEFEKLGTITDKETVHFMMKSKFNFIEIVSPVTGEIEKVVLSTSKLSVMEFKKYYLKAWDWAAIFLGLNIPDPNEDGTIDYNYSK